jgi:molybdopterin adenylyltransferase
MFDVHFSRTQTVTADRITTMAYEQHVTSAQAIVARCAIITLSDTRTESTDASGRRIRDLLTSHSHHVALHKIIPDDSATFEPLLLSLLSSPDIDTILTNGGTGISRRDETISVVERHLSQPLPGFGELFRMLSYSEIAAGAMLSRALGGIANGKVLFSMPGSTKAVELAMTKLILPELQHLLFELRK